MFCVLLMEPLYRSHLVPFLFPSCVPALSFTKRLSPNMLPDIRLSGVLDFAGSGVVHLFAGTASCAWAYILKPRRGRFNKPDGKVTAVYYGDGFDLQDRTHQALGVFLLWMGW